MLSDTSLFLIYSSKLMVARAPQKDRNIATKAISPKMNLTTQCALQLRNFAWTAFTCVHVSSVLPELSMMYVACLHFSSNGN